MMRMPTVASPAAARGRIAATAWLLAACTALFLVVSAWRIPIQVSDSLDVLLDVQRTGSVVQVFAGHFDSSEKLRPLRFVKARLLLDVGRRLGSDHAAFRGYHAALAIALVVLFTLALRPRQGTDLAAFTVALAVLLGVPTFRGMMMEAYPTNHFLEVAVCELAVIVLARGHHAWWRDAAALTTVAFAALTLESWPLLWVTAVAAHVLGWRGLSRTGVILLTAAVVAYGGIRVGYLHMRSPRVGDHPSGFGATLLSSDELMARFGDRPAPYYAYNIASAIGSILFSEPQNGISALARARAAHAWPSGLLLRIVSSIVTTLLVVWCAIAGWRRRPARDAPPETGSDGDLQRSSLIPLLGVVLFANAVLSFAYVKDEILSVSGVLYAAAAFVAIRACLDWLDAPNRRFLARAVVTIGLVGLSLAWSFRAFGLHYHLRDTAFDARNDWTRARPPADPAGSALFARIRAEALRVPTTPPMFFPERSEDWWGER